MPTKKTTPVETSIFHATLWSSTGMPLRRVKARWVPEGLIVNGKLRPHSELRTEAQAGRLPVVTLIKTNEVIA